MKLINHNENRYYIQNEMEALKVKHALHGKGLTLKDLAEHLSISYETLWRKLSINDKSYFLELEFEKLMNYTGLIFDVE